MADPCKFEEDIGYIKGTLKSLDIRVNGSLDVMQDHVRQGEKWRQAIIGIVIAGIVQIVGFAYLFGTLTERVNKNSGAIEKEIQFLYDKLEIRKADAINHE